MECIHLLCNLCNMLNILEAQTSKHWVAAKDGSGFSVRYYRKTRMNFLINPVLKVAIFCCDYNWLFSPWSRLLFLNFTKECFLTNCFLFVPERGTQPSAASPGSLPTPLAHLQSAHSRGGGAQALSFPPVCSIHPGYLPPPPPTQPPQLPQPPTPHMHLCPRALLTPEWMAELTSLPAASQSLQTWHKQKLRSVWKN